LIFHVSLPSQALRFKPVDKVHVIRSCAWKSDTTVDVSSEQSNIVGLAKVGHSYILGPYRIVVRESRKVGGTVSARTRRWAAGANLVYAMVFHYDYDNVVKE